MVVVHINFRIYLQLCHGYCNLSFGSRHYHVDYDVCLAQVKMCPFVCHGLLIIIKVVILSCSSLVHEVG